MDRYGWLIQVELVSGTGGDISVIKNAHQGTITGLKAVEDKVLSAGTDGLVKLWDLRQNKEKPVAKFGSSEKFPLHSLDVSNNRVAAGTELVGSDAGVYLWDMRTNKQALAYVDSHNDDVTEVQFHPTDPNGLLSLGSTDGLINIYNTSITDEDEAVYHTINNEASIHRAGFGGGGDHKRVFVLSHMGDFFNLDIPDPDVEHIENDPKPVLFGDVRKKWGCEYVCDVIITPMNSSTTLGGYIAAGCNNDSVSFKLMPFPFDSSNGISIEQAIHLVGAHGDEVVRAVHIDIPNQCIYTGGEDGIIKVWKADLQSTGKVQDKIDEAEPDDEWQEVKKNKKKKQKKEKKKRYEPY